MEYLITKNSQLSMAIDANSHMLNIRQKNYLLLSGMFL